MGMATGRVIGGCYMPLNEAGWGVGWGAGGGSAGGRGACVAGMMMMS